MDYKIGDKVKILGENSYFEVGDICYVTDIVNDSYYRLSTERFGAKYYVYEKDFELYKEEELNNTTTLYQVGDVVQLKDGTWVNIFAVVGDEIYKGEIENSSPSQIRIFNGNNVTEEVVTEVEEKEEFTKYDNKKPRVDLITPDFMMGLGEILAYGAEKYSADNWNKCEDYNRYYAAALRHLCQWKAGEILDDESGKPHLLHAATSLMFLYELSREK